MTGKANEPLISVVLPSYGRLQWLPRAVESVLGQTHGALELIVVDDGSPREVAPVLRAFDDPRLRVLRLPENRGLAAARNAGIAEARGPFLAFQDDDDVWHPEKLARQLRVLARRPDAGLVYSDMHRIHRDGSRQYFASPPIERDRLVNPATGYWQTYMLAMQPVLLRSEALGELRFDESLVMFEDLDLHLRLCRRCDYVHLSEPLVDYYDTGGLTASRPRELRGRRQLLAKYAGTLLRQEPGFLVREAIATVLRRSLLPIARQHWSDLPPEGRAARID